MPVGCAQHGSAARNVGVKSHTPPGEPHAASHRKHLFHIGHWHHLNSPVTAQDPPCRWCGCVHKPGPATARGLQSLPPDPHSPPGPTAASQLPVPLPGTTGLPRTGHIAGTPPCIIAPPATCTRSLPSPVGLEIKTQVKTQCCRIHRPSHQQGSHPNSGMERHNSRAPQTVTAALGLAVRCPKSADLMTQGSQPAVPGVPFG